MRYQRAVEKLRLLAEGCEEIGSWPPWDEPYLVEMYAFGPVLEGADPLDEVQVAGVIRLPPEEVTWGSSPHGTEWLADRLRLSKGGFEYWDTDWRREHRGMGRYPENELWEAVEGYLDILSASRAMPRNAPS